MTRVILSLALFTVLAFVLPDPWNWIPAAASALVLIHVIVTWRRVLNQRGYLVVCRLVPRREVDGVDDGLVWTGVWLSRDGSEHVMHIATTYPRLVDSFTTCRHTDDDLKFITISS